MAGGKEVKIILPSGKVETRRLETVRVESKQKAKIRNSDSKGVVHEAGRGFGWFLKSKFMKFVYVIAVLGVIGWFGVTATMTWVMPYIEERNRQAELEQQEAERLAKIAEQEKQRLYEEAKRQSEERAARLAVIREQEQEKQEQERVKAVLVEEARLAEERREKPAKVLVTKVGWSWDGNYFEFLLKEISGGRAFFTQAVLKIWKLNRADESPQIFKQREPLRWDINIDPISILPNNEQCKREMQVRVSTGLFSMEEKKEIVPDFCKIWLKGYRNWLQEIEWIELTVLGKDGLGNEVSFVLEGFDE